MPTVNCHVLTVMFEDRTYSLEELCAATGIPPRTVRYWIQLGLVDRPQGAGRGAHYARAHLDQVAWVVASQRKGLSLDAIREIAQQPATREGRIAAAPARVPGTVEVRTRLVIDDGIELDIEAGRAGLSPEQVRALFKGVQALHERIRREKQR